MTRDDTVYFQIDSDFAKLEMAQKRLHGWLHGEAWLHRLRGEPELMREKQERARRALYKAKSYAYLGRVLA